MDIGETGVDREKQTMQNQQTSTASHALPDNRKSSIENRKFLCWILGDQLIFPHPALTWAEEQGASVRVVMVESRRRRRTMPYHRRRLVLLLSAMRHYAQELKEKGYEVDYVVADSFEDGLRRHCEEHQPDVLVTMAASHYAGRQFQLHRLADVVGLPVEVVDNRQFLVESFNPYPDPQPGKRYVMENFYRAMRRHFGVLMQGDDPIGGQWNFDKENRKPLPKDAQPPKAPSFAVDEITQQVMDEISAESDAPYVGSLADFDLAVTRQQASSALGNFVAQRLADFGPYEDAMSQNEETLWHSVLSPYLNLGILEPMQLIEAAERAYHEGRAPIQSVEGFIRQILGWREFMYWQYWRQMPGFKQKNTWGHHNPVPDFFWTGETEMNCLRHVIQRAIRRGYVHHIERLMVLSNFAMLAQLDPAQVNDWFMAFFIDAYDWVMPPNVIGMGLNADGGLTATKPYIASANYIDKMSDYCGGCVFNKKARTGEDACPFNFLYWNFLLQHEEKLRADPRLGRNVLGLRYLDDDEREAVKAQAAEFLK